MASLRCCTTTSLPGAATRRPLAASPLLRPCVPRTRLCPVAVFKDKTAAKKATKVETVIPEPAYNVQLGLLAVSALCAYENITPLAAFFGFLGVFLTYQATQIKFAFDDEALEIFRAGKETDNVVVGGRNRWPYKSFVNWEMWWPGFPVLVYFKETQTKPEGQIHFFPIIFNGKQLYDVMVERCGPSKNSGPK